MPSLDRLKTLLGGSGRSQAGSQSSSSRRKLKKATTVHSHPQRRFDSHPDGGSSSSQDDYGRKDYRHHEFSDLRGQVASVHDDPSFLHRNSLKSTRQQQPAPIYPSQLPRYTLYDNPVPPREHSPAPYHAGPISPHESIRPVVYSTSIAQPHPSYYQPPISNPDSWEPIPDVHRQSTIIDPEGFENGRNADGLTYEEEQWRRAQFDDGEFVDPRRSPHQARSHSIRRSGTPFGSRDDEWVNVESQQPTPRYPLHRQDLDHGDDREREMSVHRQPSLAGSQSRHDTQLLHPQHTPSAANSERQSLRHKLSRMFNNSGDDETSVDTKDRRTMAETIHTQSWTSAGGTRRSTRRAGKESGREEHVGRRLEPDYDDGTSVSEDWRESEVYQYIVPPGVNVVFKDEDGNEITRVGDFPNAPKPPRRKRQSAPIVVFDQNGQVLYQDSESDDRYMRARSPDQSTGSSASSPPTRTILISPKGEQIQIGGSTYSHGSGSRRSRRR
ncbi:hypothetical protein CC2G_010622 [Coprinopsis cinerea AmutBmut pab1-1]|nr:hypothetical protein CC2G_010622 [Coprinopsis cinerea AmutBmut pab1-1]